MENIEKVFIGRSDWAELSKEEQDEWVAKMSKNCKPNQQYIGMDAKAVELFSPFRIPNVFENVKTK